jgi:ribosomal protein L7/L12
LVAFLVFTIERRLGDILRQMVLLQRKADLALTHLGIQAPPAHRPLSEHVKQLASHPAQKIEAIKAYREETGASLKDAKDAVEKWIEEKRL